MWIVCGYRVQTDSKTASDNLDLEDGYRLYDAVLDLIAGRKLLKDAETVRLLRGERLYFGNSDKSGAPFSFEDGEFSAAVYKLEFSVVAQSVWEKYEGCARTAADILGDPWYLAGGPLTEQSGFQVDLLSTINMPRVDMSERAVQQLPNDRASWRSAYPQIHLPTALFPCTEQNMLNTNPVVHQLVDKVGEVPLINNSLAENSILYQRKAAGLYATNAEGLIRFNPQRGIELTESVTLNTSAESLSPLLTSDERCALGGYLVARLFPNSVGTLMGADGSWSLGVDADGEIVFTVGGGSVSTTDSQHKTGNWIGILFSAVYVGTSVVEFKLFTPHDQVTPDPSPSGTVVAGDFFLAGTRAQIAYAAYWNGLVPESLSGKTPDPAMTYDVATEENFRALWRGTRHVVNTAENPGIELTRNAVIATTIGRSMGSGEIVAKFAPTGDIVPQDIYELRGNDRVLPHDHDRTNLLKYSEAFDEWEIPLDPTPANLAGPNATGPDGLFSAFDLAQSVDPAIESSDLVLATEEYVFSVWARSENGGMVNLALGSNGTGSDDAIQLTKHWSRVSAHYSITGGSMKASISAANGPEGSVVQIWGAQVETGSTPTAYIPTTGSSVPASFDECHIDWTTLQPGPKADQGQVRAELIIGARTLEDGLTLTAFEVRNSSHFLRASATVTARPNATDPEYFTVTWNLEGNLSTTSDTVSATEARPIEPDQVVTVGIKWSSRTVELWINEEASAIAAGWGTFAGAPTKCQLMRNGSGDDKWIGALKEVTWSQ